MPAAVQSDTRGKGLAPWLYDQGPFGLVVFDQSADKEKVLTVAHPELGIRTSTRRRAAINKLEFVEIRIGFFFRAGTKPRITTFRLNIEHPQSLDAPKTAGKPKGEPT